MISFSVFFKFPSSSVDLITPINGLDFSTVIVPRTAMWITILPLTLLLAPLLTHGYAGHFIAAFVIGTILTEANVKKLTQIELFMTRMLFPTLHCCGIRGSGFHWPPMWNSGHPKIPILFLSLHLYILSPRSPFCAWLQCRHKRHWPLTHAYDVLW